MSFNTGNPLGSLQEEDFYDNSMNLDKAMNSTEPTWTDRFGVEKPTIDAALKSAGFMPAGFDFVTGGTLQPGDRNKAVFNPAPNGDNNWYRWNGAFPKVVPANSQPEPKNESSWVPVNVKTGVVEREALRRTYQEVGLNLVEGSFEEGGVLNNVTEILLEEKTGKCYNWPGPFPKVVETKSQVLGFIDCSRIPSSCVSVAELKATEPSYDGQTIEVAGYFPDTPGVGGGKFIHNSDLLSPDDGGFVIVTPNGKRWVRVQKFVLGFVPGEYFGCIAPRDISTLLQNALNTRHNVSLQAGKYTSAATFNRHKGQVITGEGVPERSLDESNGLAIIKFTADVIGFDNTVNVALGGGIKNLVIEGPDNSTKLGIKDGVEGQEGGSSQAIGCLHENIIIKKFFGAYQLSGWGWETTLRRVLADSFTSYGFNITDAANIVHLDNCSAILSATKSSGQRTGIRVDKAIGVHLTAFRSENNRIAAEFSGGAVVTFDSLYLEGNRDIDIVVRDGYTSVVGKNLIQLHSNNNTNTLAGINAKPTCDQTTLIDITGVRVIVTVGKEGFNNNLSYYYVGEGPATCNIKGIDWRATGGLWANFSGRFAPTEMTFRQAPGVKVIGDRYGFGSRSVMESWSGATAPTALNFNITDYNGATKSLLTMGSRVISNVYSNNIDYWVYDGSTFVGSNR